MTKQLICLGHQMILHQPSGNFDLIEGMTPPHVPGPPPHYHAGYAETFLVLEGTMEFMLDGQTRQVNPGQSIDVPAGSLHTFRNAGEGACRWVNIHSPKGFLAFFEKFGVDASQPDAFAQSVEGPLIQAVLEQAARYDMHIQVS